MKRTKWIILDFVLATIVAVLGNIVASNLESQFRLADGNRFVFVGLLFVLSLGLSLFITLKRYRNEKVASENITARAGHTVVKVEQRVKELEGELLGAEAEEILPEDIDIKQDVGHISKGGKAIGLNANRTGNQNINIRQHRSGDDAGSTIGVMFRKLSNSTINIFNIPFPSTAVILFLAFVIFTIVIILVNVGIRVNINVLPTPTVQLFPPATENESLIIIVPFAGSMKDFSVYPERYIRDAIQDRVSRLNSMGKSTRLEIYPTPLDSQRQVRQLGENYGATLVIWGEFDDIGGMRVFVEILSNLPEQDSQQSSNWTPLLTLPINGGEAGNVSRECIIDGMPTQADYLTVMSFGMLNLVQGNRQEAEELFSQAIETTQDATACKDEPDQAYYWRGLARSLQGNYSSAIQDLDQALLLNPQNRLALAQRGEVYLTLGRAAESELDLRAALPLFYTEEKESRAILLDNLGVALMLQGKYDAADESLGEAHLIISGVDDELTNALNLAHIGSLKQLTGQTDEALRTYNQALTMCQNTNSLPCESTVLGNIGTIFQAKGDLETASQFYDRALALANKAQFIPGQALQTIRFGNVCLEKGDLICAQEKYSDAFNIAERVGLLYNEAQAQIGLALVEEQKGNRDKALENLHSALQLLEDIHSPDAEAVRNTIRNIQP